MAKRARKKPARPISNQRDFERASAVAKGLSGQTEREPAAELRLRSLLRELEKYDESVEEADAGEESGTDYDEGPRRRWSDDQ